MKDKIIWIIVEPKGELRVEWSGRIKSTAWKRAIEYFNNVTEEELRECGWKAKKFKLTEVRI